MNGQIGVQGILFPHPDQTNRITTICGHASTILGYFLAAYLWLLSLPETPQPKRGHLDNNRKSSNLVQMGWEIVESFRRYSPSASHPCNARRPDYRMNLFRLRRIQRIMNNEREPSVVHPPLHDYISSSNSAMIVIHFRINQSTRRIAVFKHSLQQIHAAVPFRRQAVQILYECRSFSPRILARVVRKTYQ